MEILLNIPLCLQEVSSVMRKQEPERISQSDTDQEGNGKRDPCRSHVHALCKSQIAEQ